jgi:hypothetical protein
MGKQKGGEWFARHIHRKSIPFFLVPPLPGTVPPITWYAYQYRVPMVDRHGGIVSNVGRLRLHAEGITSFIAPWHPCTPLEHVLTGEFGRIGYTPD